MLRFLRHSFIIASKDLTLEYRSRERIVSMLTFAVLVAVVFSFTIDPTAIAAVDIGGAMLWVTIIFAGMLGLGRSFTLEREQDAIVGVLLTPVDRGALYFGKFLANLAMLVTVTVAVYMVYALFFELPLQRAPAGLAIVTLLACVGFMAVGTVLSAVTASTRLGDTLLPIVILPLLAPVVIFSAAATQRLLIGRPLDDIMSSVRMLIAFDIVFVVVCTLIFSSVVEE